MNQPSTSGRGELGLLDARSHKPLLSNNATYWCWLRNILARFKREHWKIFIMLSQLVVDDLTIDPIWASKFWWPVTLLPHLFDWIDLSQIGSQHCWWSLNTYKMIKYKIQYDQIKYSYLLTSYPCTSINWYFSVLGLMATKQLYLIKYIYCKRKVTINQP